MKQILIFCFLLFSAAVSIAQEKILTMEEAVLKQKTTLAPQKLAQHGWIPKTDNYFFIGAENDKDWLMTGNAEKGPPQRKASLNGINTAIQKYADDADTLSVFPVITWLNTDAFTFKAKKLFTYSIKTGTLTAADNREPAKGENTDTDTASGNIAFTRENNLFVFLPKENKEVQVTNDSEKNIVNGKSVHRDEWGIFKGTFWSPKGNYLAFYRMDQTMVTDYPVIDFTNQPAKSENIKYPMAGGKSHEVTVGVYDMKNGKTIFLQTGEPKEQYLTNIAWSPDEKHIYIAIVNRAQDHMKFNCYDSKTGVFEKTLFEETDTKYVHPMHPMLFVKNHPDLFLWQSERDGYNNLYLYTTDGKLIRKITNHAAPNQNRTYSLQVLDVIGFDAKGDNIYYTGITSKNFLGREIRMAAINGKHDDVVVSGDGSHKAILSPSGKYIIDSYSSVTVPKIVSIIDKKGNTIQTLLNAANPLKDYKLGKMRLFTIKAADDSTDLFCRMILPVNFDSTKKYPVIVYLYGGPNAQLITNTWLAGSDLWYQYMAERGYILFTVDSRGSGNRGIRFEQATFRNLGTEEMNDQLKGVDYLKSLPYADQKRMGVFGWSYGGFITTSLMTRHAGIFKTAVAGGPVIDWSYYEIMYTERYMDTPQENKEGYAQNSLLNYAQNLKGKLLLIHGTSDDVVVWQHSILFLKKCVEKGALPDYFVYPGHLHNVLGKDRVHLFEKITEYFKSNL